jgi:hypothetical protein
MDGLLPPRHSSNSRWNSFFFAVFFGNLFRPAGIIGSVLVNILFWPYVARIKVRLHLGDLLRQISMSYLRAMDGLLVKATSIDPQTLDKSLNKDFKSFRRSLLYEKMLLSFAKNEFSLLHGTFNEKKYSNIINCVEKLVDEIELFKMFLKK